MAAARDEFCRALDQGDVAKAEAALANVLSSNESMHSDTDPSFATAISHLVDWLMQSGCVVHVDVSDGILKTYPPQKRLVLTARTTGVNRIFQLKLRLGQRMEIHVLEG
jgi:hypothetical protein